MANSELREYELVYILQPEMDEESVAGINDRLSQVVTERSGSVTTTELWGRRALAYPIGKFFEGQYVMHRFQMPPEAAGEVDRLLRLNENVIRYLLIRTDE